jgi:hypothetical protein
MLLWSAIVLGATVLLGLLLLIPRRGGWGLPLGLLHAAGGAAGLAALLLGLRGPPHGLASGAGGFGITAAALLGAAMLAGLVLLQARLRRRGQPMLVIGLHASVAIMGYVILAAYISTP